MLHTGLDHKGVDRTAVCCLSSVNAEKFLEWKKEPMFLEDVFRFLDNVLEDFIERAPPEMARAVYSAKRERSVGLGLMGFHSFLQSAGRGDGIGDGEGAGTMSCSSTCAAARMRPR
jgi:ribonucleoside-diphosphate reductase alpha chain